MTATGFHQRLLRAIRNEKLWSPRSCVLVAVSGGADSMALLDGLAFLAGRRDCGWELHVAHLDHGLRGRASRGDARFVSEQADVRGLPIHLAKRNVASDARRWGVSVESAARRCRHAFFRETAEKIGAEYVAVAHHVDDQAETVLHHILRGTGWTGLSGMPVVRWLAKGCGVRIARPLLGFHRAELREYLVRRRVPFREDASNRLTRHTRNRIRHQLLPLLEKRFNPNVTGALLRLSSQASSLQSFLTEQAAELVTGLRQHTCGSKIELALSFDAWRASHPLIRATALRIMLERAAAPFRDLTHERLFAVATGLAGGAADGMFELPGGVRVCRARRALIIRVPVPRVTDDADSTDDGDLIPDLATH